MTGGRCPGVDVQVVVVLVGRFPDGSCPGDSCVGVDVRGLDGLGGDCPIEGNCHRGSLPRWYLP